MKPNPLVPAAAQSATLEEPNLLVVSNRLPILLRRADDGSWRRESGSGGLVTALDPVLRQRGGTWVGWPGVLEGEAPDLHDLLNGESSQDSYRVEPVSLTRDELKSFYLGFCNEVIWPLFHGFVDRCRFETRFWDVYRSVNRKYARAILRTVEPGQVVWVHDYHLMSVGEDLREAGCENRTGFFLHIPFPAPELFERLPWSREILRALLEFDTIGFQTRRDWRNFMECVRLLRPTESRIHGELVLSRRTPDRPTRVGVHPISIDCGLFGDKARTEAVRRRCEAIRSEIGTEHILLGVDRLDYSKGIPEKLLGFERALERYPELRGRMTLVQLLIPSREAISEYDRLKDRIELLVGRINGRFTRRGWAPIQYQFGSWSHEELLAAYRAADVAVVTSLRDGMNLVSKEYVAASVERGALVLSEFAGSAEELRDGALLVNPHDVQGLAEALYLAVKMPSAERVERVEHMQAVVRENDVHQWVDKFLARAGAHADAEDAEPRYPVPWASGAASPAARIPSRLGRRPARTRTPVLATPSVAPSREQQPVSPS